MMSSSVSGIRLTVISSYDSSYSVQILLVCHADLGITTDLRQQDLSHKVVNRVICHHQSNF